MTARKAFCDRCAKVQLCISFIVGRDKVAICKDCADRISLAIMEHVIEELRRQPDIRKVTDDLSPLISGWSMLLRQAERLAMEELRRRREEDIHEQNVRALFGLVDA